jgi:hypothetical protein
MHVSRLELQLTDGRTGGGSNVARSRRLRADRCWGFVAAFDLLPLTLFGSAPYSLDEAGVVKCVCKAGCAVGARMQIADKMTVDLSHVDRRTHEPTRDPALVGWREWDIRVSLRSPA